MFKQIRTLFIVVVVLVSALPLFAQEAVVDYRYDGVELQKLENGVVVQSWTMPNSLETQQTVAALRAEAQTENPEERFVFDHNLMYHLLNNEGVGLSVLRGGEWMDTPVVVEYAYNGEEL